MIEWAEGGWYLPDGEEHLQQWMRTVNKWRNGRLMYQAHKYERALKCVDEMLAKQKPPGAPPGPPRGVAIDVGAHVGLWSWPMALDFEVVYAFEPVAEHRECWVRNLCRAGMTHLLPYALGETPGTVRLQKRTPGSSGDTGVDPVAERSSLRASVDAVGEEAELRTLDSFGFQFVSFIKLDCEGYEYHVLRGARETILRCRPVLIVEQKPETGMEARYGLKPSHVFDYLGQMGMTRRASIQGDHVFAFG